MLLDLRQIGAMLIYNVTVNVDFDVEEEWVHWMKTVHIPNVLATGKFFDSKLLKLLGEEPDATGTTYATQYFSKAIDLINTYLNEDVAALRQEHMDKFGSKTVAFRTLLEEV